MRLAPRDPFKAGRRVAVVAGAAATTALYLGRRYRRSLYGQVAVVTGGSRGLGLAIAGELARAGCPVVIAARDPRELAEAARQLREAGADVSTVVCDVGDETQAHLLVDTVLRRHGRIDILVNNAGVIQVAPLATLTAADFREAMHPALWGMVYVSLAALPHMRQRGRGHIVNVTSIGGKIAAPHLLPYTTAKFAAVGFSDGLRTEAAKDTIRVTTVVPGLMRTGSDVQATFGGNASAEYAWFAIAGALPGLSMDGRRAARRIVRGVAARRTQVVLTLPARLAAMAYGLAPGPTQSLLAVANRLMPGAGNGSYDGRRSGRQAAAGVPAAVRVVTATSRRAGAALNQPAPDPRR